MAFFRPKALELPPEPADVLLTLETHPHEDLGPDLQVVRRVNTLGTDVDVIAPHGVEFDEVPIADRDIIEFYVTSSAASRLNWAVTKLNWYKDGRQLFNCVTFAYDYANVLPRRPVPMFDGKHGRRYWNYTEVDPTEICEGGIYRTINRPGDPRKIRIGSGHWFLALSEGQQGTALHVNGPNGSLVTSTNLHAVKSWDAEHLYLATPKK